MTEHAPRESTHRERTGTDVAGVPAEGTHSPGGASEHANAERILGTVGPAARHPGPTESRSASRLWWDADADDYLAEHGSMLGEREFLWCPERLRESEAGLLGEVSGRDVLEVGCGAAACSRWLASRGARPVGLDISGRMLSHAAAANARTGTDVALVQGSADMLPFAADSFDIACSAFGGVPFVADSEQVMREVARVLRPGGLWVFAVTHPVRWAFPDDPGPEGLTAVQSYFDRSPYVEIDATGRATYVEHHRTLGDYVSQITSSGFRLLELVEPEWPEDHTQVWGQWSPLRGRTLPGTAIFRCLLPERPESAPGR
ncbi:class I SAM-dependent methyltransferase [Actinopolyspora mortivallis]|uniref:class I SAM-dependent methyltransferase n=1 Tax=Actinopolyspora mortivallis TaxID=33906 RepID=UPI00037933FA|nr:class I SAM-dependent methyltransferase [Actinopolyspora mortivallis]